MVALRQPPGRANARPMTGSAKQSIVQSRVIDGLLRRFAPRDDGSSYGRSDCITRSTTCLRRAPLAAAPGRAFPKSADRGGGVGKKKKVQAAVGGVRGRGLMSFPRGPARDPSPREF